MNVAVIGCNASEIISACHFTLLSLAKKGHKTYAIITPLEASKSSLSSSSSSSSSSPPETETGEKSLLAEMGISQIFVIETFDYSAITQANADAVNVHIKAIKPSLVIMPSWKSQNNMRRILARVSLIACRGIGTILMYELDSNNIDFVPSVTFEVSAERASKQLANDFVKVTTANNNTAQGGINMEKEAFTNSNSALENKGFKTTSPEEALKEKFESHRTLLLEEGGLF